MSFAECSHPLTTKTDTITSLTALFFYKTPHIPLPTQAMYGKETGCSLQTCELYFPVQKKKAMQQDLTIPSIKCAVIGVCEDSIHCQLN